MAHIPRRHSPTTGVPPEVMQPPRPHAPIPVQAPPAQPAKPARLRIGLAKISPHTYVPDETQLWKTLFGKEPDVDPLTGQLVPAQLPSRTGPAFGNN